MNLDEMYDAYVEAAEAGEELLSFAEYKAALEA